MKTNNIDNNLTANVIAFGRKATVKEQVVTSRQKYRLAFPEKLRQIINQLQNPIREQIFQIELEYHMEKLDPTYDVLQCLFENGVIDGLTKEKVIFTMMKKEDEEIDEKISEKFERFAGNSGILVSDQMKQPKIPSTKYNTIGDIEQRIQDSFKLIDKIKSCYNKLSEKLALDDSKYVKNKLKDYKTGLDDIKTSINKMKRDIEKEGLLKQEEARLLNYVKTQEVLFGEILNRHKSLEDSVKPTFFRRRPKVEPMLVIIEESFIA